MNTIIRLYCSRQLKWEKNSCRGADTDIPTALSQDALRLLSRVPTRINIHETQDKKRKGWGVRRVLGVWSKKQSSKQNNVLTDIMKVTITFCLNCFVGTCTARWDDKCQMCLVTR